MKGNSGQSLVEVALVLPVLMTGIFVTALLGIFCHNRISLQSLAYRKAKDLTAETRRSLPNTMWGHATRPVAHPHRMQLRHAWRPFYSLNSVQDIGQVSMTEVASVLRPGPFFSGKILPVKQQASAIFFVEPLIPAEN